MKDTEGPSVKSEFPVVFYSAFDRSDCCYHVIIMLWERFYLQESILSSVS